MSTNLADQQSSLVATAGFMDKALMQSTGLPERERRLVTYWTLATHMLPHVNTFPLLVLRGKMGTGKSDTLRVTKKFAYQPLCFSLGGNTLSVVRDKLVAAYQGTAIIEEADKGWKDDSTFERLLSDRYHRQSAETAKMEKSAGDQWTSITKPTFGATALHRRNQFNDAALDGRSIVIRFKADYSRQYVEVSDDLPWIVKGSKLAKDLVFVPIAIDQPQGVAPRIFDTYRPLCVIAKLCGDEGFTQSILERLLLNTAQLKEAQSMEPDGLVLRAIISLVGSPPVFANIKFRDIANWIWDNHRQTIQPKQIGALAREELGLATKESHGVAVVVPKPISLLKACYECGYEDNETIAEWKQHILEKVEQGEKVGEVE
jgi:hypothetical protein